MTQAYFPLLSSTNPKRTFCFSSVVGLDVSEVVAQGNAI